MPLNHPILHEIEKELASYPKSKLMIVTKNQTVEDIQKLFDLGYNFFAENRVQEIQKKYSSLRKDQNFKVHLIGPLQSNKVKITLDLVEGIQSVDREKLVYEILKHKTDASVTKDFYIQVNIGKEIQKSGVEPQKVKDFYKFCLNQNLNIRGLMCIPPQSQNPEQHFKEMINLKNSINEKLLLSMGMSADYKLALKWNSDLIRVGSSIFTL